jgi:voltage-gated potassium channel Kch
LSDTVRSSERTRIVLAAAGLAYILGYLGYRAVHDNAYSPSDALYWSLALFVLHLGPTPGGVPLALNIARFLAAAVAAYAVVATVALVLRDRWEGWLIAGFARDHTIVMGSGPEACVLIEALRAAKERVVAIASDAVGHDGAALRTAGARVLAGDPCEPALAVRAGIAHAKRVVIISGEDERNLESLGAAVSALGAERDRSPVFHVELEGVDAWRELSRSTLADQPRVPITFFNTADRTALTLLSGAALAGGAYAPTRVAIDGSGPVAVRTAVHVVRRALIEGLRPEILLQSARGGALQKALQRDEPWCLGAADLRFLEEGHMPSVVAFVCDAPDDATALARGSRLARELGGGQVLVAVRRMRSGEALREAGLAAGPLRLIATGPAQLAGEMLERSDIEIIARARHEDYVRRELARGITPQENASLVDWEHLPRALRESNRRFAESLGALIGTLGAEIRPLAHAPDGDLAIDEPFLERLARAEHGRWVSSLEADGWRLTTGEKDPAAKLHPLLIPWEQLSDSERAKDRDVLRSLPLMLAYVGYELVMPGKADDGKLEDLPDEHPPSPASSSRGPAARRY